MEAVMHFNEIVYTRPDMAVLEAEIKTLLDTFRRAQSVDVQNTIIEKINALRIDYETMETLNRIRYSIDTENPAYKQEKEFYLFNQPVYKGFVDTCYREFCASPFRDGLIQRWGSRFFDIMEMRTSVFTPSIVADLQRENRLVDEYQRLTSGARITFRGEEKNLPQMIAYFDSLDRSTRRDAQQAFFDFYGSNGTTLDRIYDELVALRHSMARTLGYTSFTDVAYRIMGRTEYDSAMVARFRKQVEDHVVPLTVKLHDAQKRRLGLEKLRYYDLPVLFKNGSPRLVTKGEALLDQAQLLFSKLSPLTGEYFTMLRSRGLLDLLAKLNKSTGGYCTTLLKQKVPFIFANFNGTFRDIEVLVHEAGHGLQSYLSRDYELIEYKRATSEAAEIHSMGMEFFTLPWMDQFFGQDAQKYRYNHLVGSIQFIPYGVAVDEFQHFVYANPTATPRERHHAWREIERRYLPHLDYDGNEYLEKGGFWQKQLHIYHYPFYYIDYTLALTCALQFWKRMRGDQPTTWKDYCNVCAGGGYKTFLEQIAIGNLRSPFEEGTVESIVREAETWLSSIDESAL